MQLETLPSLVQQQIAHEVARSESVDFCSLRATNRYWKVVCNEELLSLKLDVKELPAALPFISRLTRLKSLSIRSEHYHGGIIEGNALAALDTQLSHLELSCKDVKQAWGYGSDLPVENSRVYFGMVVRSLGTLLNPWVHSLTSLHLEFCSFPADASNSLTSPGFFSTISCLQSLTLTHSAAIPSLDTLNLAGCTALRTLVCNCCHIVSLHLTACTALTSLDCGRNNLTELDLASCTSLLSLNCRCQQNLEILDVSACFALTKLDCSYTWLHTICFPTGVMLDCRGDDPLFYTSLDLGGVVIIDLHCEAGGFASWPPAMVAQLEKLDITNESDYALAGFQKLRFLSCELLGGGSLDLSACSPGLEVEIECSEGEDISITLLGRSFVQQLTLTGRMSLTDFSEFTTLQQLVLRLEHVSSIDLTMCPSVRVVMINSDTDFTSLTTINLDGCCHLELLQCNGHSNLKNLDVSTCKSLTSLKCTGSGLKSLDVSCCLLLETLQVSSESLEVVHINSIQRLTLHTKDCSERFKVTVDAQTEIDIPPASVHQCVVS